MKKITEIFKLMTDEQRLRILMLLKKKDLSVCQLMGIIGASQPLISRNLSILYKGGFLDERREGKLRFYSIRKELSDEMNALLELVHSGARTDPRYKEDMETLNECTKFQKKVGKCDMKTLQEFMENRKRRKK